jgi:hypothetical protein
MRFTVEAGPGHVWGTGPNDDPQFLVPLSIPGRPLLYAQVPPCDPIGTPPTNAEAHLTWFDTSFHQTTTYFPPSDSYILTFDAVVLARQTPLVALTLSPLADYVSANGPAVVLLEYR